ncbi:hypothetical protein B0H14DRAFT_2828859 [Mycena olivaceomarginata]|nr:hypothetical protein B0H14DRAFT_2828859 [Mycena olivaceomarginata]
MGYMSIYDVNSTPDYPSSSPSRSTGYKRPSSPTPLLGTSPKRAHLSTHYDNVNWDSPSFPALATAIAPPFTPVKPVHKPVKLPRTPVPILMSPGRLTTASLSGLPQAVETKADIGMSKGAWDVDELSTFYEFCLGQDADSIFQKITLSSNKCWKQIQSKVGVARSATQMKNQWETSLSIYKKLVPLLKFTGGGADADEEPDWEDKEAIEMFLKSRKTGGHDIEGLSAKKVKQWQTNSWFGLWNGRYGENPKAVREVPRSSADTLSDIEGGSRADDDNNNDSDIETIEQPTATPAPAAAAKVEKGLASDPRVVKPSTWDRSKPASRVPSTKVKKEDRLQGLNNYLEGRVRVDEQAMKLAKAEAEFKRLKATETTAKEIVMDNTGLYGEETKQKARRVLDKLMDAALDF